MAINSLLISKGVLLTAKNCIITIIKHMNYTKAELVCIFSR